jgi:hypothetical protein
MVKEIPVPVYEQNLCVPRTHEGGLMPSTLSQVQKEAFLAVLHHIKDADKGYLPDGGFELIQAIFSGAAVEVIAYQADGRFLLVHRSDQHLEGWHIPGGFMRTESSLREACEVHLAKDGVSRQVTRIQTIGVYKWRHNEHPFGYPTSIVCACTLDSPVEGTDKYRWFEKVPARMLSGAPGSIHTDFLEHFIKYRKEILKGRPIPLIGD